MPELPFNFTKRWSKEAKLDRIASRRLGASIAGFKSRGPGPNTLQVDGEGGASVSRRNSTVSLRRTPSVIKNISDNFGRTLGDLGDTKMSSLRSDYKKLIKLLDDLDYPGWKGLAGHLKRDEVKSRLADTTG
jgi:hypothetical protein